jgi:hypothetical protein
VKSPAFDCTSSPETPERLVDHFDFITIHRKAAGEMWKNSASLRM